MRFQTYLLNYYNCSNVSPDNKFPYLPSKKYISLAIIEKEWVSRAKADQFTKDTLHGHPDEIMKKKKPIKLEAVLEPPKGQQIMKCVFIEGAPGVGKSTFAWELCKRQKTITAMKKYSLVVLLRLREKRVQDATTIHDLFYHDDSELQLAVTKEVVACDGRNVLFILDGFDELPVQFRIDSFIVELIQGRHLPACTVLVTSRPSATADLLSVCKPQINKHIEVLGFTQKHVEEYAESMLSDQPDILSGFLKYIGANPGIRGMMYVPLNCAIVLEIYKANSTTGRPIPFTMTQLYTELCQTLLTKYLLERNDPRAAELLKIGDGEIKKFPQSLQDQLTTLSAVAFQGTLNQQITFKELPDDCDSLGFMNVSTTLYLGRKSIVYYSFLHLTLQEFLAAFHVSRLPPSEQKELFEKLYSDKESHLTVTWKFLAGLTGWENIGWNLLAKPGAKVVSSFFVQCVFEACAKQENMEIACRVVQESLNCYLTCQEPHQILCFRPQTAYDCYVVGFCIATSAYSWSLDLISLEGDEIIEILGCGLMFAGSIHGSICKLNLAHCGLTRQAMIHFSKFPPEILRQISDLDLCNNDIDGAALSCFANSIVPQMATLVRLDLSNNPGIGPGHLIRKSFSFLGISERPVTVLRSGPGMMELFKNLALSSNLKDFEMINVHIDSVDVPSLCQLFRPRSNLRKFKVGNATMTDKCVAELVEIVLMPSSLKELELWFSKWTFESANKFNLLRTNCNLISLEFHKCFAGVDKVIPIVAEALQENKTMRKLSMPKSYFIRRDLVDKLSNMLKVNQTLQKVEMSVNYGCSSISTIESVLQMDKSRNIQVCINYIGVEWSICSRCDTLDQRIQLSPELKKSAELRSTCVLQCH